MKQPDLVRDLAASEKFTTFDDDVNNVANPSDLSNFCQPPPLETWTVACRLKTVLSSLQGGMNTFQVVFDAYQSQYGEQLHEDFLREVSNDK